MTSTTHRPISEIAREILRLWPIGHGKGKMYFGAVPYAQALVYVDTVHDMYGSDNGDYYVRYFLSNAATWKGEDAKRIKQELKSIVGLK